MNIVRAMRRRRRVHNYVAVDDVVENDRASHVSGSVDLLADGVAVVLAVVSVTSPSTP